MMYTKNHMTDKIEEVTLFGARIRLNRDGSADYIVKPYSALRETSLMGNGEVGYVYDVDGVKQFDQIGMHVRGTFFAYTEEEAKEKQKKHWEERVKEAKENLEFCKLMLKKIK